MATYTYPTSTELREIESEKIEVLEGGDPFSAFMPTVTSDDWKLRWAVEGFLGGLQQLRGLDVAPQHVERFGYSEYEMEPGVYGEHMSIKEEELTKRATSYYPGGGTGRIDITDIVTGMQDQLLAREIRLIRYIRATLFVTGTFAVADKKGAGGYRHTDTYSVQTYDATTWATVATATPIADFRAVNLLGRGLNADFGGRAIAVMNRTTFNNLIANTNALDLGGQKTTTLSPLVSVDQFNTIMLSADLPRIVVWDEGYYDSSNNFQLYIPNGKVVVLSGQVVGGPIGEYRQVFQAVSNAAGPYTFVWESSEDSRGPKVPPTIQVHRGHNGGPVIFRPKQIVVMDVS